MVKIAHHYNYNAPACTMSSLDVSDVLLETDTSGEEEGVDAVQTRTAAAGNGAASADKSLEDTKHNAADGASEDGGGENNLGFNNDIKPPPSDEQPQKLKASTTTTAVFVPVVDERRRGRTSSTSSSASPMTPVKAVDAVGVGGGLADSGGSINSNIGSGSSPRPSEGSGNGRQQQQQQQPPWSLAAPVQSSSKSYHSGWGDDRHVVETQPGVRPTVQGNNIATGVGGGGRRGPEWASKVRELTRLWVRAVGSLCCPSHSELWAPMIDAGMIGALNR